MSAQADKGFTDKKREKRKERAKVSGFELLHAFFVSGFLLENKAAFLRERRKSRQANSGVE